MSRRAKSTAATRQSILDAACRLIVESRSANVQIASVAQAADISIRTVYNYFPSVDHLMGETMDQMVEEFLQVGSVEGFQGDDPEETTRGFVLGWFENYESHEALLEALLHIHDSVLFEQALNESRRVRRERMHDVLRLLRAPEDGQALHLAYALTGFASWRALTREQGLSTRDAGLLVADALIRLKNM